jgi:hypothetical protein
MENLEQIGQAPGQRVSVNVKSVAAKMKSKREIYMVSTRA